MNDLIKDIFLKYIKEHHFLANEKRVLNKIFIEICNTQIQECADSVSKISIEAQFKILRDTKNIAL